MKEFTTSLKRNKIGCFKPNNSTKKNGITINCSTSGLVVALALVVFCYLFYVFYVGSCGVAESLVFMLCRLVICLLAVTLVFVNMSLKEQLLWLLLIASFFISYLIHPSGLEYFCNTFVFLGVICVLPKVRVNRIILELIVLIYAVFTFFILSLYTLKPELVNSNSAGQVSFCFICLLFALIKYFKKKYIKVILFILAVLTTALCITYKSRAIFICIAVLYFSLALKFHKRRWVKRRVKFIFCSIYFLSILFAYLYAVPLYDLLGDKNIMIFGKSLFSGRAILWRAAFNVIKSNFWFGIGNTLIVEGSYAHDNIINYHNQMLGFLAVYGIFFTVAFISLFSDAVKRIVKCGGEFTTLILLCVFVDSLFETCMYSTPALYIAVLVLITYTIERFYTEK